MIEVIAYTDMVDANAVNDVIDVFDHIVRCSRSEKLADCGSECRSFCKIINLPIEFERIVVFYRYSSGHTQGYKFFYKFRLRDID